MAKALAASGTATNPDSLPRAAMTAGSSRSRRGNAASAEVGESVVMGLATLMALR